MKNNTKTFLGWIGIIVIVLIPALAWFYLGEERVEFSGSRTHSLGELFGLIGMTMFSLTFLLSTRIEFIEDIFGGLDKVYIVHAILGGTALIFILFHPIFLVLKFIPAQLKLAASYLLPSSYWSVNFGIIALLGLIVLIGITLFTRIKYHKWKFSHEFLGLVFALAVLHIFLVRGIVAGGNIFSGYYFYAGIVSIIGIGSFLYSLFIKGRIIKNAIYTIKSIKEKGNTFEIVLIPEHKPITYKSGQFVFIRFYNNRLSSEAHPFSIASKPDAEELKIVIKKLGDYTQEIGELQQGDEVAVEGPYGRFNCYSKNKEQVWIAAGIGITPFIGMTECLDKGGKVDLYHTARDNDFIGEEEFSNIQNNNFKYTRWDSDKKGKITIEDVKKGSGNLKRKEFFMCGPTAFKESMIKGLLKEGVDAEDIHQEDFDFI